MAGSVCVFVSKKAYVKLMKEKARLKKLKDKYKKRYKHKTINNPVAMDSLLNIK